MLWILFLKECKQMLRCLTFYVIIICIVLMYTSQLGEEKVVTKPVKGLKDYGYTLSSDKTVIMDSTVMNLAREYTNNKYVTYPFLFYRAVTLNKAKQIKMQDILSEATGMEKNELDTYLKKYFTTTIIYKKTDKGSLSFDGKSKEFNTKAAKEAEKDESGIKAAKGLTYEHFTGLMKKADQVLGGGSNYSKNKLKSNAYVPMTYEQALREYNDIIEKDHLTGAYARYFCDYLGIVLAILPVFMAVTRVLRDRRAGAAEIIYSRKASSLQIVLSRYLAMTVMLMIPVGLLAASMDMECINIGKDMGVAIDYLAFPRYLLGWLMPTLMVTLAVGMFLTELTDTAAAILVQGLWWFFSLVTGKMSGNCGWNLIPRHNNIGQLEVFKENYGQFMLNRLVYSIAAIIFLLATVYIFEMKRKGRFNLRGKIFTNRKIKYSA